MSTYILRGRDEGGIENEHADWTDVLLDGFPSVVFGSNTVPALAPVIECKTCTPYSREHDYIIQSLRWQSIGPRPNCIMNIVEGWQQAPESVDLRVVLVHLGADEEEDGEEQREPKCEDQRVRVQVDMLQSCNSAGTVGGGCQSAPKVVVQAVELGDVGLDRSGEIGCLGHGVDGWEDVASSCEDSHLDGLQQNL